MANMNNEIFPVLRKNQYLAVLRNFFADVSKKRKTQYLKNDCTDFLDFLQRLAMIDKYEVISNIISNYISNKKIRIEILNVAENAYIFQKIK